MSALTLSLTLFLALVSPSFTSSLDRRQSSVTSNCKHDFAVTWNDGPYLWTEEIVDEFDCVGGKTTFFVNGNYEGGCIYSEENVQRLRYAFESGHQIASGSWSHADFSSLSNAQIDVEVQRLDEALIKILGVKPKFFRAPSSTPSSVAQYISQTYGKTVITSDIDSNDASGSSEDVYQLYADLAQQKSQPHLSLNHETSAAGLDALDMGTINLLGEAGIKLLSVASCLDTQAYDTVGGFGNRDASWTCDGSWTASTPLPSGQCTQTYSAGANDKTCDIIAAKFGLTASDIYFANPSWLNCANIWQYTPVCIPPKPTPITNDPINCVQTYYTVQGDSCASIAAKFSTSPGALLAANTFANCLDLWAGTPLCIPPPTVTSTRSVTTPTCVQSYNAQTGDTCTSIGAKFGVTAAQILFANSFLNCADIWPNTPICIPPSAATSTSTTSTTSTATSTSTSAAPTCIQTYSSQSGDDCAKIATKFGLSAAQILTANSFLNCADIWVNTPICIPPGGTTTTSSASSTTSAAAACVTTYTAGDNETCTTVATKFGLSATAIYNANSFVGCDAIWKYTPLCIPPGGRGCTNTITSWPGATCATIAQAYGTTESNIKFWNDFVTCNDIWTNTPICVAH